MDEQEQEFLNENKGLLHLAIKQLCSDFPDYKRIDYLDLLQVGRIGMLLAYRTYDPTRAALSTYVTLMVRWEIQAQYGRKYQNDPLFKAYHVEEMVELSDFQDGVDERDEQAFLAVRVRRALKQMHKKYADVLSMRYGFWGKEPMSLEEIGMVRGRTRETIRQILLKATQKLLYSREFAAERYLAYPDLNEVQNAPKPLPAALQKMIDRRSEIMAEDTTIRIRTD